MPAPNSNAPLQDRLLALAQTLQCKLPDTPSSLTATDTVFLQSLGLLGMLLLRCSAELPLHQLLQKGVLQFDHPTDPSQSSYADPHDFPIRLLVAAFQLLQWNG